MKYKVGDRVWLYKRKVIIEDIISDFVIFKDEYYAWRIHDIKPIITLYAVL